MVSKATAEMGRSRFFHYYFEMDHGHFLSKPNKAIHYHPSINRIHTPDLVEEC
jgi:hypothetical protein